MPTPSRLAVVPRLYPQPEPRRATREDSGVFRLDAIATERCLMCGGVANSGACVDCGATPRADGSWS